MDLHDSVVLVTGASSGIGAATAERFAREGADVALLARSRSGLEVVAQRVRAHGRRALVLPCDITDRRAVGDAVARAQEELGGLDVLVSNAAAVVFGRFEEVSPEDFDRTLEVTFTGAVNVIRACLPTLARRHGTIVVVGSIMVDLPLPTYASYAAAKHALKGFLESFRIELHAAGDPVTVSLVNPGAVNSPLWLHTTTATGKRGRKPLEGYHPDLLARAIVSCAQDPRPEITVGGESHLLRIAWKRARPVGEVILGIAHRLYRSGVEPATGRGALWEPSGDGLVADGVLTRPSLFEPVRAAVRRGTSGLRR